MNNKGCERASDSACVFLAWTLCVISIMVFGTGCQATVHNQTQAISEVLDHLLDGYNKELRPGIGGDRIVVETGILIKSMGPISENDMSYSMQIYLRQKWKDPRLSFFLPNVTEFTLSNLFLRDIWKPNSYFLNGRESKQHNLTVPNAFVRLRHDGSIYVSMRLTVNARCPMMLSRYPMDRAVCPLFIASFGYTTEEILYKWMKEVEIDPGVKLSQFELGRINQRAISKTSKFGEFSILEVYIHLTRAVGFYILQTYVPCYLIVSISWVSFWINRDAAPARVLLGVTTILSTSTICMTVREGLPRVPYATALDVFINVCIVYEMAALMEYAAVNYYTKLMPKEVTTDEDEDEAVVLSVRYSKGSINEASCSNSATGTGTCNEAESNSEEKTPEKVTLLTDNCHQDPEMLAPISNYQGVFKENDYSHNRDGCLSNFWGCIVGSSQKKPPPTEAWHGTSVSDIDIMARLYFPMTFAVFNIGYWIVYIYVEIS